MGPRSALARRASDQLKPSPIGRRDLLDISFWVRPLFVLADNVPEMLLLVEGLDRPADDVVRCFPAAGDIGGERWYLPLPMLPARASRNA